MIVRTHDINIRSFEPLIDPNTFKEELPSTPASEKTVIEGRRQIEDILAHRDQRLLMVVGPCSIHDEKAALEYAERLVKLQAEVADSMLLVMRVYFEKPRTTVGWKGLINDPDMDGTHCISKGLGIARQLFGAITDLRLPIASEMLDPITPHYLSDMISWGAIGARTTESQTHREMASGLSFPVGFKNGTDGGLKIATDAMAAACRPHSFLGINFEGRSSIVHTTGNPDIHIVLRGGNDGPNYAPEDIAGTIELLKKNDLPHSIMVDCSHANSYKDHNRQGKVLDNVLSLISTIITNYYFKISLGLS